MKLACVFLSFLQLGCKVCSTDEECRSDTRAALYVITGLVPDTLLFYECKCEEEEKKLFSYSASQLK